MHRPRQHLKIFGKIREGQTIRKVMVGGGGEFPSCKNGFSLTFPLQEYSFRMQEHYFWATRCARIFRRPSPPPPPPITFLMVHPLEVCARGEATHSDH